MLLLPGFRAEPKKQTSNNPFTIFTFTGSFMEATEGFFIPPTRCYRFSRWIFGRTSSRKACMELPALEGNSTGGHPPLALPAGQTPLRGCFALILTVSAKKSFSSKFGYSVESGTLTCSGQVHRSWVAAGYLSLPMSSCGL